MKLWDFLSLGNAWNARETGSQAEMLFYLESVVLSISF